MKNTKYKINSWVITAFVIVGVILVNIIVSTVSSKVPLKIDLTQEKIYELTDDTKRIAKELDKNISAYILAPEAECDTLVKEYVSRYSQLTNKIDFQYIDIYKNQSMLTKYQQKGESITAGDIIFECDDNYKIINISSVVSNISENQGLYSFDLEAKMTSAILSVTGKTTQNKFYFLTGHGEQKTSNFDSIISDKDNKIETISILTQDIPDDANVLVTVTPTSDFTEDECDKIDRFLDNGGKLMVLYTPGLDNCVNFEKYLSEWGITPVHGLVVENDSTKYNQSPIMFYPELSEHDITSNINAKDLSMLFYGSIGFEINNNNPQNATVTSLAQTSTKSLLKAGVNPQSLDYEDGDIRGPIDVCVLSEKENGAVFVIGSAHAFELNEQVTGNKANSIFTENAITYLTNSEDTIDISSKIITHGLFTAPNALVRVLLYYVLVWIIPIALLLAGIIIWLKRRYL